MERLFRTNTSHEIHTPLNTIVGFSELLATDLSPAKRKEYAQVIRANDKTLLQVINNILDRSNIETGTLEFIVAEEDQNIIIEELVYLFRSRMKDNRIQIGFDRKYPSGIVLINHNRLSQAVSNFANNAKKFTSAAKSHSAMRFGKQITTSR